LRPLRTCTANFERLTPSGSVTRSKFEVDCRRLGLGDDPARVFLDRGRVAVNDGLAFGPQGAGFVRVNLATPHPILEEAVRRMGAAL